jgi:hypothetical protein
MMAELITRLVTSAIPSLDTPNEEWGAKCAYLTAAIFTVTQLVREINRGTIVAPSARITGEYETVLMKRALPIAKRLLTISIILVISIGLTGCAAFLLASAAGSLGYAGYQYADARSGAKPKPSAQPTPNSQPTLTLNDIE